MTPRPVIRTQSRTSGRMGGTSAAPGADNTTRPLTHPLLMTQQEGASSMLPNTILLTARDYAVALLYANRLEGERLAQQLEQWRTSRLEVVRLARVHAGMSNIDIGKELGVSDSFVSRIAPKRGDA